MREQPNPRTPDPHAPTPRRSVAPSTPVWAPRTEDKRPYFAYLRGERVEALSESPNVVTLPPRGLDQPVFVGGQINPANPWGRFVYTAALRYRDSVQVWEIWNEPDFDVFWNGSVADYLRLLRTAYTAIKAANPSATVLVGGMMYWEWANRDQVEHSWLRAFLAELGQDPARAQHGYYFDGIPWHFYSRPSDLYHKIRAAQALLAASGITGKEMWITETNAPACGESAPDIKYVSCTDPGYKGSASVTEQASYVLQAFAYGFAGGARRIYLFQHQDDGVGEAFGLARNDGQLRPAYVAYQLAARYLSNFGYVERTVDGSVERISFRRNGTSDRITILFNTAPNWAWTQIQTQSSVGTLVDQDGTATVVTAANGSFGIPLDPATNNKSFAGGTDDYIIGGRTKILFDQAPLATFTPTRTPTATASPVRAGTPIGTATPRPTGVPATPGSTPVVLTPVPNVRVELASIPSPPTGSLVRVAVAPAAAAAIPIRLPDRSRPVRAVFLELTFDSGTSSVVSHDPLPQPALVSLDFTRAELSPGADPLAVKLYLSSDGVHWELLPDTRVEAISAGYGYYRASAHVPHFSYVAAAEPGPPLTPSAYLPVLRQSSASGW